MRVILSFGFERKRAETVIILLLCYVCPNWLQNDKTGATQNDVLFFFHFLPGQGSIEIFNNIGLLRVNKVLISRNQNSH